MFFRGKIDRKQIIFDYKIILHQRSIIQIKTCIDNHSQMQYLRWKTLTLQILFTV